MAIVTTTEVAPAVSPYYDRNLLENARPHLIFDQFAQNRPLPQKNSLSIKFRRASVLASATTPLTEGITPTGTSFSYSEITATVKQYGDFVTFSDLVDLVNQDSVLTDITTEQGAQSGLTIDLLRRDVLVAGTSVQYSGTATTRATVDTAIAGGDIDDVVRGLQNSNAMMIMEQITASNGVSTEPIAPAFFGVCHPDVLSSLRGITGVNAWIPARKYANTTKLMKNEEGSTGNVRWVWTTNAKIFAGAGNINVTDTMKSDGTNADVYISLIFAKNAYGIVPLEGKSLENIVKQVGSAGASDPLNQRGSSGWKAHTTTVILNETFMYRIESTAVL